MTEKALANQRAEQLREENERLSSTHADLYRQLQETKEIKRMIKAEKEEEKLNEKVFEHYNDTARKFFQSVRNMAGLNGKIEKYTLKVTEDFDLCECLDEKYSEFVSYGESIESPHAALFLDEANGLDRIRLTEKVISRWDIHIQGKNKRRHSLVWRRHLRSLIHSFLFAGAFFPTSLSRENEES